ncbi:MAG: hypothetical protein IK085_07600 [Clostridia bacterium]|nr:hypothetical protein [Clostridia bacterium]
MKNEYRINLRMNPNKPKQKEIIDFFNERKNDDSFSRNEFIIEAILCRIHGESNNTLLDDIREVIRDEIKNISVIVSNDNENDTADIPELTEEQLAQNEADVLDVLDMF